MVNYLNQSRWLIGLRGVLAIVFGVLAFVWPGLTAVALVFLFGAYAFFDGLLSIFAAVRNREVNDRWWLVLLEGLVGIAAGVIAFLFPVSAGIALLFIIAAWAIITGVLEIMAAVRLRQEIDNEWVLGLTGVLSILLGAVIFISPGAGLLGLVWAIGGYAILFGLLMLYLAFTAGQWVDRGRQEGLHRS